MGKQDVGAGPRACPCSIVPALSGIIPHNGIYATVLGTTPSAGTIQI